MGAYRPLNRVVPLHFKLRWPRNYSGTTSLELPRWELIYSEPQLPYWFPLWIRQQAAWISRRSLLCLRWMTSPFQSLLAHLGRAEALPEGCPQDPQGRLTPESSREQAGCQSLACCTGKGWSGMNKVDTEGWCSGSKGSAQVLWLSRNRTSAVAGNGTHLTILILNCLLCRGWSCCWDLQIMREAAYPEWMIIIIRSWSKTWPSLLVLLWNCSLTFSNVTNGWCHHGGQLFVVTTDNRVNIKLNFKIKRVHLLPFSSATLPKPTCKLLCDDSKNATTWYLSSCL